MSRLRTAQPARLASLLVGLALVAAACTGSADDDPAGAGGSDSGGGVSPSSDDSEGSAGGDGASGLYVPGDSDEPLDLSGGAVISSEGVTVVTDDPKQALAGDVRAATDIWPTDWSRQTIDVGELQLGIPTADPRDRIPPIDDPKFEPIAAATWLGDREPGALVQLNGEVRFYPLSILTRHEIVNDRFGDLPVVVSYCPLCNTAITFDARVGGQAARFGVSGLLRNSDLVMWDDATVTLWQQLTGEAIVGELAGTRLELIPTSIVSYADAVESFPDAYSLSQDTGFPIGYGSNSYTGYSSSDRPFLYNGELDPRYPALSRVVGVTIDDEAKAYPFEALADEGGAVNDVVGGVPVAIWLAGDTADALDQRSIADSTAIGTGIAFDRRIGDQELTFSAAGDDQFTDVETASTWTLLGEAIDGPLVGERLQPVIHRNEFWFAWTAFFPESPVLGTS